MRVFGQRIPAMYALLIWALLWEGIGRFADIMLIPPLTQIFAAGVEMVATKTFRDAIMVTLEAFLVGMILAIVVGVVCGILMARIKLVGDVLGMWVNIFESSPLTAIIPVLMAIIGFGQPTIITAVFLFAVWVIALDTQVGVKEINPSLIEMARSFGANQRQLYGKILFFAALPEILTGLRLGFIRGVKGCVIGQLLIAIVGVGKLFELYSRNFLMDRFWALILIVFAFAFLGSEAIAYIERRVEYYAGSRR